MAEAAGHRGPDGIGTAVEGPAGLAHLEFALCPESLRESQPVVSAEDRLVLVAATRLDNRDDLCRTLAPDPAGSALSDAMLLLAAYRRWGPACVSHLLGDFSFAVYDATRRRLFAARDPMAMRPFYYRSEPRRFLFGSEVKQILAAPGVTARLHEPAVAGHLTGAFGHLEWTFYEGVAQLPPAYALLADANGSRTWRWWDIDPDYRITYRDRGQYVEHLRDLFLEAVRCRIQSRTPVGVFLSGGLDSGSIAATAAWLRQTDGHSEELRMYCWAFEEVPQCDERHISDQLVSHYGLPVTYISADASRPLDDYPAHGPDRDEPFIGPYQPLIERALEAARAERVGLVLSGDRGDLLMGNWVRGYLAALRTGGWTELWRELRAHRQWTQETHASIVHRFVLQPGWDALMKRLRGRSETGRRPPYPEWISPVFADRTGLADIVRDEARRPAPVAGYSRGERYRAVFMPMQMRGVTLTERTHALSGTGFADPWSDRRIASFVLALPQQVISYPGGPEKPFVRQAMSGIMPDNVRRAARKIVPYPLYLRALRETAVTTIESLLRGSRAGTLGYIEPRELRTHYDGIRAGQREHPCFWWALSLEMWLRAYWA
jgi:asparagine synthase (glutamine-hydrolysing)